MIVAIVHPSRPDPKNPTRRPRAGRRVGKRLDEEKGASGGEFRAIASTWESDMMAGRRNRRAIPFPGVFLDLGRARRNVCARRLFLRMSEGAGPWLSKRNFAGGSPLSAAMHDERRRCVGSVEGSDRPEVVLADAGDRRKTGCRRRRPDWGSALRARSGFGHELQRPAPFRSSILEFEVFQKRDANRVLHVCRAIAKNSICESPAAFDHDAITSIDGRLCVASKTSHLEVKQASPCLILEFPDEIGES